MEFIPLPLLIERGTGDEGQGQGPYVIRVNLGQNSGCLRYVLHAFFDTSKSQDYRHREAYTRVLDSLPRFNHLV